MRTKDDGWGTISPMVRPTILMVGSAAGIGNEGGESHEPEGRFVEGHG